jgi:hypothetical protein
VLDRFALTYKDKYLTKSCVAVYAYENEKARSFTVLLALRCRHLKVVQDKSTSDANVWGFNNGNYIRFEHEHLYNKRQL